MYINVQCMHPLLDREFDFMRLVHNVCTSGLAFVLL